MTERPISAVIEHTVTTTKGGAVERMTARVNGTLVFDSDKAIDLDVIAHAITHAEAFLRELAAMNTRDHARADGHADELARALAMLDNRRL